MSNTLVQLKDPNDSTNVFYPITTANAVYCDDGTGTSQNPNLRSLQSYIDDINAYQGGSGTSGGSTVTANNITLNLTAQQYITVNGVAKTITLPSSDPWSTPRTPTSHTHNLVDINAGSNAAAGDLMYYNGTSWSNLARGTDGQVLKSTSSGIAWGTDNTSSGGGGTTVTLPAGYSASTGITLGTSLSSIASVGGTELKLKLSTGSTSAAGVVQLADTTGNSTNKAATQNLASSMIPKSIGTAQGDIIYFTGSGTPARLAKGTAGQVLTMNSGATAPTWSTPSGGGGGGGSTVTAAPNQNAVTGSYPTTIGVEVGKVTIDNVTTSFIIDPAQSGYDDSSLPGEQLPWVLPMGAVRPIATTHGLIDYKSGTPAFIGKKVEPPALNKITKYWTDLTQPGELENGLIAIPVLTDIGPVYIDEDSQVRITESVPYILLPSDLVTGKGQALFEILGGSPISEK